MNYIITLRRAENPTFAAVCKRNSGEKKKPWRTSWVLSQKNEMAERKERYQAWKKKQWEEEVFNFNKEYRDSYWEQAEKEQIREEHASAAVVSVKISAPNPKNWSKNSKGLGRKKKRGSGSRGDKQARRCVLGNFEVPASVLNAFESSVIQKPLAFNKESKAKKRLGMRKEKFRRKINNW